MNGCLVKEVTPFLVHPSSMYPFIDLKKMKLLSVILVKSSAKYHEFANGTVLNS